MRDGQLEKYLRASSIGASVGIAALSVDHPLDLLKTRWQAMPNEKIANVFSHLWGKRGIAGFYAGFIPNACKVASKQIYRWPLILILPNFFQRVLPEGVKKRVPRSVEMVTGVAIASIESLILCPMERLKVFLMTEEKGIGGRLTAFFQSYRGSIRTELFRGISIFYLRQIASWGSFLTSNKYFMNREVERIGEKRLPISSLLRVGGEVAVVTTVIILPLDMLKTCVQKFDGLSGTPLHIARKVFHLHGMSGLYTGWQIRMVQYLYQSILSTILLESLQARTT